jgi:hypothetical protein
MNSTVCELRSHGNLVPHRNGDANTGQRKESAPLPENPYSTTTTRGIRHVRQTRLADCPTHSWPYFSWMEGEAWTGAEGAGGTTAGNPAKVVGALFFLVLRAFLPHSHTRDRVDGSDWACFELIVSGLA